MTATTLITAALQDLGVLGADETVSGTVLGVCLSRLQDLVDEWAIQALTMPTITRTATGIVSGTSAYTIGSGATINVARPASIDFAAYLPDPSASVPVEIPLEILTPQRYAQWPDKTNTSDYPQAIFYTYGYNASGYGTVLILPVPSSSTPDLVLYTETALVGFADATTAYTFAPGTASALRMQLAVSLAPLFHVTVDPRYAIRAELAFSRLKAINTRPIELTVDPWLLVRGVSNIYNDV